MSQNRKGFVNLLPLILIGAFVVVGVLGWKELASQVDKAKQESASFGAANTELTDTIGTFRTNYNTLNHQVVDTTSTDPGHKHTTSTITGVFGVASGGTGAVTHTQGALLVGNGTSAVTSLTQNGNGSIPIASGTTWVANTLTAGTNITITTSTGSITINASLSNIIPRFGNVPQRINDGAYVTLATSSFGASGANDVYDIKFLISTAGATSASWNLNVNGTNIASTTVTGNNHNTFVSLRLAMASSTSAQNLIGVQSDLTANTGQFANTSIDMSVTSTITLSAKGVGTDANTKLWGFEIIRYTPTSVF